MRAARSCARRGRAHASCLALALSGCTSRAQPARPEAPPAALDVVAPPDAPPTPRCPVRAHPPEELSVGGTHDGPVALAFNGRHWGVAWTELIDDGSAVYFVRLSRDGRRVGNATRVTEPGYRGHHPAVAWNGEAWAVAYAGGATQHDELWLALVDARGVSMSRPHQITVRERDDGPPALHFDGANLVLAWTATNPEGRHAVLTLRMSLWGAQLAPPTVLVLRSSEKLSRVQLVAAPPGTLLGWLASSRRGDAIAVESVRLDAAGAPRGAIRRAGPVPLGGGDTERRFSLGFDGERASLAWDEVRDGLSRARLRLPTARLEGPGAERPLSDEGEPAREPALATLGRDTLLVAYQSERSGTPRVRVRAVDAAGNALGEAIELQGHDRRAEHPVMLVGDGAVGVATVSPRAVSFHRVELGACVAPPPEAPGAQAPP